MKTITLFLLSSIMLLPITSMAFDSGSTGADGTLNPTADITVQLPPDGILNYDSVNIPAGITVTFAANAANTPAILLVQNNAVIDGDIDISGQSGNGIGLSEGGPGGFRGGQGGQPTQEVGPNGQNGFGPGGGEGGLVRDIAQRLSCGGAGASYQVQGDNSAGGGCSATGRIAPSYGSASLVPLLGGSGGGGGSGAFFFINDDIEKRQPGSDGGGGGGAMLLAASGFVVLNGNILARGGNAGDLIVPTFVNNVPRPSAGAGGSGGAVRIVATSLSGTGGINVSGGLPGTRPNTNFSLGGEGAYGRIRLEADSLNFEGSLTPTAAFTTSQPRALFVTNLPTIRITSIAGTTIPAIPTQDVLFPSSVSNPVTIELAATNVPLGSTLDVTLLPDPGSSTVALSSPLAGTLANSTATASVTLPQGRSTLTASVNFTVAAANQMDYSNYAMGDPVEQIKVATTAEGKGETTFITISGKEFTWPSNAIAMQ